MLVAAVWSHACWNISHGQWSSQPVSLLHMHFPTSQQHCTLGKHTVLADWRSSWNSLQKFVVFILDLQNSADWLINFNIFNIHLDILSFHDNDQTKQGIQFCR